MEREDLVLEENSRVALISLAAGERSPSHYHSAAIEQVVCVRGKITLALTSSSSPVVLSPGQRLEILPGVKHSMANFEVTASTYLLVQQGQYDFVPSSL
jgi:quercetin dioxygenase-like cupin family protein